VKGREGGIVSHISQIADYVSTHSHTYDQHNFNILKAELLSSLKGITSVDFNSATVESLVEPKILQQLVRYNYTHR
jgi:hypothetical protein